MSGQPARVGASRASGVGAPPVLLCVESRAVEPANAAPRPPDDPPAPPSRLHAHPAHPPLPATLYYKPLHDNKITVYGAADGIAQRTQFFSASQQYKDLKPEEGRNERVSIAIKRDRGVETFQSGIPVESDQGYQRCSGPSVTDTMPSMQQIALRQGHNQISQSATLQEGNGERELSVGKSYVNYQILEQSVSHQSIVNQSISILNQQVGVNRGISSEGDSVNAPQLVRTADGVVLAVLPAPLVSHTTDTQECSRTVQSDSPQTITVPLGWRRIISGTSVLYLSPSGTALSTLPQLREYLQTTGTCKCGLPCPLRPETAFSFDFKVASKPYQAASGAELTKLCNHKRKLLATLQARAQSPATPPPHHIEPKKVAGTEVAVLKKKMKKRPGFPANASLSQLMVQRERPLAEFKPQDNESNRDIGMSQRPSRPLPPAYAPAQHVLSSGLDPDSKQDAHVQKSSHYITVNNGWITQQKLDEQKPNQPAVSNPSSSNNGLPVRGANGQIIGINTAYTRHPNYSKQGSHMILVPPNSEPEQKEERKETAAQQNMQQVKYPLKEEESQMFCGLNQALTPEVMQKINEQQQIFIQQNQKQIEMAMKGYRTQLSDNTNQNNPQNQGQYSTQGQLVIQNGAVVKTNPAKTPPWQVKRTDSGSSNPITSPGPKLQKIDSTDYEDSNANMSEDSSSSFSSFSSNEPAIPQGMCPRVPPLPQHYNMMNQQWPAIETNKKKGKAKGKKKNGPTENKNINFGNNGMRLQETKGNPDDTANVPSFMDDPSGYLAQQTVLLNNTISRQVGMNSTYDGGQFDGSNHSNFGSQHQMDKLRTMPKPGDVPMYRNNAPNASPSSNTTPDSSVLSDKMTDNIPQCCKGCSASSKSNSPDFGDNQMRLKYMKHNLYRMESDGGSTSSPRHFDDNPVTSSTFTERNSANDNCSPIQAGTVSTSNVSETMQQPEPSPTLSNSSRNTDTPHSSGSNGSHQPPAGSYHMPSPAYSGYRDNFNGNPPTPGGGPGYPYNSPGPPATQSISGTQMMHFISNHNVNKNLMEVDNISMVGVKPAVKTQELMRLEPRRKVENSMPGYCPPPHMGGGPAYSLIQTCYVQTFVTTMASGFSVTRDTVTSVLAGKANTATTSINAARANFIRPPPPPSVNMATTYAIPNNQPDPFLNSVNLPTSYPLHIAGTTAQNMISKSPLEMVQNVIGNIPSKSETNTQTASHTHPQINKRTSPGQILISSTGQIIVSNNQMPPPPPKMITTVASGHGANSATDVSGSGGRGAPPGGNQPTVVVNTLQAPFVIQPPMMAVDGQVVQQSTVIPQIVAGGMVSGPSTDENARQMEVKSHQSFMQGVAMLSPESLKKRSKKKKNPTANIANVLQITAPQQNQGNIMVHSSPQHNTSPQFSPRGFQLSPNNNMSPTPMLQALTIVPGKSGTPAHIVMNGQGNANNFGSQQIITNTSPSQQINLLQPVNLINNAGGVMPNFPAFQQFIVPNLGGMMMTADGTTIIQDSSTGMPVQLQLQTVNGQNVLTPVQNSGMFTGANGGVVIRAQNQQGKIIQSQHSPGAQFLSPNSQVMMNSPNFNGQLSPLLANLSPTNVTFNAGQQVRSGNVQTQEFIQTNQMGQALMVPVSPKQTNANRTNSTFVHQNTTIVQQQTTLVSNSHNAQMPALSLQSNRSRLNIDPNVLIGKQIVQKSRNFIEMPPESVQKEEAKEANEEMKMDNSEGYAKFMSEFGASESDGHVRHSVSTQTLRGRGNKSPSTQAVSGSSPPDTTTHSPLGALEAAVSPRLYAQRCVSTQGNYADTTTKSPEPADANSSAMVQCVSSSEPDMAEARDLAWPNTRNDFHPDNETHNNMMSNMPMMRQNRAHNPVESSELHYNQNMNAAPSNHNPHAMPMASNYYERPQTYKRKNDFGDGSTYRSDKIMRTNSYNSVHGPKETEYDMGMPTDKPAARHYQPSGSGAESSGLPRGFDRHNLGANDDANENIEERQEGEKPRKFHVGDLVWGPVKGYASWPGKLVSGAGVGDARWTVRWFGADKPSTRVHTAALLTLSEGLEAHHAARTKHRKSRKLNTLLENAIQEAMAELDKASEGGDETGDEPGGSAGVTPAPIDQTHKRRKPDKAKSRDKNPRKNPVKIAPNPHKTGDGARLRSSR